MAHRIASVLMVGALLLPACTLAPPLPRDEWDVAFDPLYPPTVWIETADLCSGGGVIVASGSGLGTIVLTARHVVRDAEVIRVGIFRHSRIDAAGPEYVLYPAEIVSAGFVVDERLVKPIRELTECYRALLQAADASGRLPRLEAQLAVLDGVVGRMESARNSSGFASAMDEFCRTTRADDPEAFATEIRSAIGLVSEKQSEQAGRQLAERFEAAAEGMTSAIRRFGENSASGFDVAILRIRTDVTHHVARCRFAGAEELSGTQGQLVTIRPEGQPRVRQVQIGGDVGVPGLSEVRGLLEQGNSGSPVFVDGCLIGILDRGIYLLAEGPPDRFDQAAFLRIRTIRDWLARRQLDGILDPGGSITPREDQVPQ